MKVCWNITNLCNENCFYCFRELQEKARPFEDNITILNKLKNIGVERITYAGGEPLLYNGIEELFKYGKELGIENALITNGKCLTSSNLDKYLPYLYKITFSIDSPSEYINSTSGRGRGHYEHIKSLLPYIKEKYPNIILEVNTVATKENLNELDFMFEALGSEISFYGLKKWKISRFCPLRGYAKQREELLSVSDEVFLDIEKKYAGIIAPFEISVRNQDAIDENLIISPAGSLKKSNYSKEEIIVSDIVTKSSILIARELAKVGYDSRKKSEEEQSTYEIPTTKQIIEAEKDILSSSENITTEYSTDTLVSSDMLENQVAILSKKIDSRFRRI